MNSFNIRALSESESLFGTAKISDSAGEGPSAGLTTNSSKRTSGSLKKKKLKLIIKMKIKN